MNVKLTFGIPMYNSEKYILNLLNCFDSNFNDFNYEILIIDDGSEDNSFEICNNIKNPNLRIIKKKNGGVSSARNEIIEKAKGQWITFIDSDDLILFDSYINAFNMLVHKNSDFLINSKDYSLIDLIEKEIINSPCMKFYNTNILRKNKIKFKEDISIGEDLMFNLQYYKFAKNICFYNKKMYIYRKVNNNSLTLKYRNNKFDELMRVNNMCKELFNNKKILKSFEYIRIKNCISCIKSELIFDKVENIEEYINKLKKYSKKKYFILNNIKTTLIYYGWYILPNFLIILLIRKIIKTNK